MQVLITGATGLIGNRLAWKLAANGHHVRALVRNPEAAQRCLPTGIELIVGDITDRASLAPAVRGSDWVFHAAGLPEQWQADEGMFDRVNHHGTINVLEAALAAGVHRVIYTSTMDVFAAPTGGTLVETHLDEAPKPTAYERSKVAADRAAVAIGERGLDVVHLNPAAVYGPAPVHVSLNSFIIKLLNRQVPLLPPGGMTVVYVDDVVDAHLAAAEQGKPGERYLLSDRYLTMSELATAILLAAGSSRQPPTTAPLPVLQALAAVSAPFARWFGGEPLIAPGQLAFLQWQIRVDAGKAVRELGFRPTPLDQGLPPTLAALQAQDHIRR